jgi:hypothetical protein
MSDTPGFSLDVATLGLSPRLLNRCKDSGIALVGELLYLRLNTFTPPKFGEAIGKVLASHGYQPESDPLATGWTPPYWCPAFVNALDWSVERVTSPKTSEELHLRGIHSLGQLLQCKYLLDSAVPSFSEEGLTYIHSKLQDGNGKLHGLKGGMLLPPDWCPSLAPTIEFVAFQERLQQIGSATKLR